MSPGRMSASTSRDILSSFIAYFLEVEQSKYTRTPASGDQERRLSDQLPRRNPCVIASFKIQTRISTLTHADRTFIMYLASNG